MWDVGGDDRMRKPKFQIGDLVTSKVEVKGSYEPSILRAGEGTYIDGIRRWGDSYIYTCGYDGYEIKEKDLVKRKKKGD